MNDRFEELRQHLRRIQQEAQALPARWQESGDEGASVHHGSTAAQRLSVMHTQMNKPLQQAYLVRHGETEWSLSGKHTGIIDIPLTANGRSAAKLFAPLCAKVSFALVLTSPLERARTTCELADLGGQAEIDRDLMEWNYGQYEGLTPNEIHAKSPEWMLFNDGCPGGESPEEVGARVDRVIARVRALEGHIALFGHGHVLRVLAARWLGLPAGAGCHFMLDTATLSVLSYYRGIPAVERWNAPLLS